MHRIATIIAAATVVTAAAVTGAGPALAAPRAPAPAPSYYVSLGDSLAQGVQPNAKGVSVETNQGYANQLYTALKMGNPLLKLEKLGCPGETTTSMLTGAGSPCAYPQGSQLAAALAFLRTHHGQTALITIDIGANDVDGCITAGAISQACVASGLAAVQHDLPLILGALRHAAGGHVLIAGMNLYDPFLADYLTGAAGQAAATQSVTLGEQLNQLLTTADNAFGARTADVAGAFSTTDFTDTATLPGAGTVPLNVARICTWTWMCAPPPVGPNIHANATGYKVIAAAFERVISQFPGLRR